MWLLIFLIFSMLVFFAYFASVYLFWTIGSLCFCYMLCNCLFPVNSTCKILSAVSVGIIENQPWSEADRKKMKNLGYRSPSPLVIVFIHINILVTPFLTHAEEGFDSVIRLPHSGSTRTRTRSKWVLSVTDFGAKGDGFHNDTDVRVLNFISFIKSFLFISLFIFGDPVLNLLLVLRI